MGNFINSKAASFAVPVSQRSQWEWEGTATKESRKNATCLFGEARLTIPFHVGHKSNPIQTLNKATPGQKLNLLLLALFFRRCNFPWAARGWNGPQVTRFDQLACPLCRSSLTFRLGRSLWCRNYPGGASSPAPLAQRKYLRWPQFYILSCAHDWHFFWSACLFAFFVCTLSAPLASIVIPKVGSWLPRIKIFPHLCSCANFAVEWINNLPAVLCNKFF